MGLIGNRATPYSASALVFTLAGFDILKGIGPDTVLEIDQEGETVTYAQGLDGEGVFSFHPGGATRAKVTLMQTSAANQKLSALYTAAMAAGGLLYPCTWADGKGTSSGVGASAAITKLPPEKFGKEADVNTWEVIVHDPARIVGGH